LSTLVLIILVAGFAVGVSALRQDWQADAVSARYRQARFWP
jgi:hypothetical protein